MPAVSRVWQHAQASLLATLREDIQRNDKGIAVGGDGRCDSPGHNAKYGSYTIMDTRRSQIVDTQLVQCSEVTSSNAMEKEGLVRVMVAMQHQRIKIDRLITDRHASVKKYMRENYPKIKHFFDVWHVAKGIKKKLLAKGKQKGFELLKVWAPSIVYHVYWCAATSGGNAKLLKEKWLSILNHVANIHEGHGTLFPRCEHGPLEDRMWITKGSRVHKALAAIINSPALMRDIGQLSPRDQTSGLESFHKIVCFFAPKSTHYFYLQMRARVLLAALHFNENSKKKQRRNRKGEKQFAASYPKHRKGDGQLKEVKTAITFQYVDQLLEEVMYLREQYPTYELAESLVDRQVPQPITTTLPIVSKEKLIDRHRPRQLP